MEEIKEHIHGNKGKHHSEEHKKNLSIAKKGKYIGVNNPFYGKKHTEETRNKIGIVNKGRIPSEETRKKLKGRIPWNKGKINVYSEEVKRKMSIARLGQKHSEESRKKISIAGLGRQPSNITREKIRNTKLGKCRSEETKLKISLSRKGKYTGINNPFYGKYYSLETRKKNSLTHKGKRHTEESLKKMRGENNHCWRGGISFESYGIEFNKNFKDKIRERDSHRCQECFRHESELPKKLHIHHIDFNKKNNFSGNLISLCGNCHSQTNFNRKSWIEYFQNRLR